MARILVAYGTKMGGTAGIAAKIGEVLTGMGHEAIVLEAGKARLDDGYDAAVVGSGLYAGMWRKPARKLVRALADRPPLPLWLFHSGPIGEEEAGKPQKFPAWLAELEGTLDLRDKATFGGLLADDAKGFMVKSLRKKGWGGDYRDWDLITAWAEKIAADL